MNDELFRKAFDTVESERVQRVFQEYANTFSASYELPRTIAIDPQTEKVYTGYRVKELLESIDDLQVRNRVVIVYWSERDTQPGGRIRWRKGLSMPAAAPGSMLKYLATKSTRSSTPASKADCNSPTH